MLSAEPVLSWCKEKPQGQCCPLVRFGVAQKLRKMENNCLFPGDVLEWVFDVASVCATGFFFGKHIKGEQKMPKIMFSCKAGDILSVQQKMRRAIPFLLQTTFLGGVV